MSWLQHYIRSSIGKKQLMAITGIGLVGFLFAHLAGNLTIFAGRDAINSYAQSLVDLGPLLWVARGGLIFMVLLHIWAGITLAMHNRASRPVNYKRFKSNKSTFYGRLMIWSGVLLLVYIGYHLAHFTLGLVQPELHALVEQANGGVVVSSFNERHDVYGMVVGGFQNAFIVALYVTAMLGLSMHVAHAIPSFFQTLGFSHPKYKDAIRVAGPAIAILMFIGYASIPLAVLFGVIKP